MSEPIREQVKVAIACELSPLNKVPSLPLETYAKQMIGYLATQIERFADKQGGDTWLMISVTCNDKTVGESFRSGHYVKKKVSLVKEKPSAD